MQIHIEFERLEKCIVTSGPNVAVKSCGTGTSLTNADLSACIETTYVYLDDGERNRFATTHFEVLICQTQAYQIQTSNSQVRMQLNFNHPVIELMWAVRRSCNEKCNAYFHYGGIDGRDPVVTAALYLNNQARFVGKAGSYFRLVQPYQHHTNVPDCFIYCFSFALHPEEATPSGSCNMSRIDHVDLSLQLQEGLGKEQVTVIVFCRNWNILRFREGLGGQTASPQQPAAESRGSCGTRKRPGAVVPASRRVRRSACSLRHVRGRHVVRGRRSSPRVHALVVCA